MAAIWKRLLSVLLGTGFAFVAGELAFRLLDIHPPQPDDGSEAEVHWSAEVHGRFHDSPWQIEKPEGVHRTIALGDSFTLGQRVPLEDLFVKRVERSLNARSAEGRRYEIYNLSLAGWNTRQELAALRQIGLAYDPDTVIVFFFLNDATGLDSNPEVVRRMHEEIYVRGGWLNEVSLLYDWVDFAIRRQMVSRETLSDYRESFLNQGVGGGPWERSKKALAEMRELSRERGFALGLVIFPMLVQLDAGHEFADIYAQVEEYCASLGIPTLNLLPTFIGHDEAELWVSPTNAHPNSFANGLAAAPIEEFLVREGLVPSPPAGPRSSSPGTRPTGSGVSPSTALPPPTGLTR